MSDTTLKIIALACCAMLLVGGVTDLTREWPPLLTGLVGGLLGMLLALVVWRMLDKSRSDRA